MIFGEPILNISTFYFPFIFYLKKFHGPVITSGNGPFLRIHDKYAIERGIINSIHKLFLLQDGHFIVPVYPKNGIGEKCCQHERDGQVTIVQCVRTSLTILTW